tara:strand:+ start:7460 stop:8137 length:678 start_codon:yes stop_codon:yes gene_type:complete
MQPVRPELLSNIPETILYFNNLYDSFFGGHSLWEENHQYFGNRLLAYHCMQNFEEFWGAADFILNRYENKSLNFLEIGAARGLWPFMLHTFANMYNIDLKYTTITMMSDTDYINNGAFDLLRKVKTIYSSDKFTLIDNDSRSRDNLSKLASSYDIVYIDGCHEYDCVMSDIELYSPLSTDIVMFHDIRPKTNEVYRAIKDSRVEIHKEFVMNELIMGIGMHFINE